MNRITRFSLLALIGGVLHCPVEAASAAAPGPEVSVSLRGIAHHTIEVGEPLFVAVRIEVPEESSATIELAPGSGTWADTVEVEISGAVGGTPKLQAQPAARPENAVATLDADRTAGGVWFLPSAASAKLAPGKYLVHARLVVHDGKGWKGEAMSEEILLHIVAPAAAKESVIQRNMALAHEAVLADAPQEAARLLDALLAGEPDNIPLLTVRGALCARGGDYRAALVCVNRAMNRIAREKLRHPPVEVFELENQVMLALQAPVAVPVAPPAWTRLPASVLAPLLDEHLPKKAAERPVAACESAPTSQPTGANAAPALSVALSPVIASGSASGTIVASAELAEAKILADPAGQWAVNATAGTKYGKTQYSPAQATGAPNVSVAGNSPDAWCPERKTGGSDWLEVSFSKPVNATGVRIRQNDAVGAIAKVEAIEPDGTAHVWWEGIDPYKATTVREIVWFAVRVPKTSYSAAKIRITLNLSAGPGWKQIDAVQLVGTAP